MKILTLIFLHKEKHEKMIDFNGISTFYHMPKGEGIAFIARSYILCVVIFTWSNWIRVILKQM